MIADVEKVMIATQRYVPHTLLYQLSIDVFDAENKDFVHEK